MTSRFRYFSILLVLFAPIIFMFGVVREDINVKEFLVFMFVVGIAAVAWDIWSTKQGRKDKLWIWRFNINTTTGYKILGHPIEEYMIGFGMPLWIVLIWEVVNKFIDSPTPFYGLTLGGVTVWEMIVVILIYKYQTK